MTCSVLICTYNRHELLSRALHALLDGTTEKPDQVVVVNAGDERADQVVAEFRDRPGVDVTLVKTVNKNLACNRNVGLPYCSGDIIAMTDDDAEVFPDWVAEMKRVHQEHPEAGAVGGPVVGNNMDGFVPRVADLITFPTRQEPCYVRTIPGVNVSYKTDVVARIGTQDEMLFPEGNCGEDVDYNWRVQQVGYEVFFHPGINVYHHHRSTLRGFLQQHYMYGRGYYLVRRKWPDMYCVYPHGFSRLKDVLKAVNVVAALVYQPIAASRRMPSLSLRVASLPILFLAGLAWKGGMLTQACRSFRSDSRELQGQA